MRAPSEELRTLLVRHRPRIELALSSLAILVAALLWLLAPRSPLLLSYLFVPVAIEAALFGWKRGCAMAAGCVALAFFPWLDISQGVSGSSLSPFMNVVVFAFWGASLVASGALVGRISDEGGSFRLLGAGRGDPIMAAERERSRMSLDIHDGMTQSVAAALMEAEILESLARERAPELAEDLHSLKAIISTALQESREMIGQLRPPPLEAGEFPGTLQRLVEDFVTRSGVETDFELEGDFTAHTVSMRICVYRVLQEALANVEQHAEASRALVSVRAHRRAVVLLASDNGQGFDLEGVRARANGHYGLAGMDERISHLGGFIQLDSKPGAGTNLRAYIPGRLAGAKSA